MNSDGKKKKWHKIKRVFSDAYQRGKIEKAENETETNEIQKNPKFIQRGLVKTVPKKVKPQHRAKQIMMMISLIFLPNKSYRVIKTFLLFCYKVLSTDL